MKQTDSILDKIIGEKRQVLKKSKNSIPEQQLIRTIDSQHRPTIDFYKAIKTSKLKYKIVGEIKQSSPSSGVLRKNFSVPDINTVYQSLPNIVAISVLTESKYFNGSNDLLTSVGENNSSHKPILRKDFIFDPYQVLESKLIGADAFLLIARLFDKSELTDLVNLGLVLNVEPLVEIHSKEELDLVIQTKARCVGVNSRNLSDFSIDLSKLELLKEINSEYCRIAESGIDSNMLLQYVSTFTDATLIGSYLMKSKNIEEAVALLVKGSNTVNEVK